LCDRPGSLARRPRFVRRLARIRPSAATSALSGFL